MRLVKSSTPLLLCIGLLQMSQVLILPPGTSASPWDAVTTGLSPQRFGPFTAQEWALAAVALVSVITWAGTVWTDVFTKVVVACCVLVAVPAIFTTVGVLPWAEALGKVLLPLVVYGGIRSFAGPGPRIPALFLLTNIFVVAQTFVSKMATGEFAANSYYLELDEEYFGYFHHPFAFTGILGVCTIVAVHHIVTVKKISIQALLIPINLWLMYASQVRTFFLALICALAALALALLFIYRQVLAYGAVILVSGALFVLITRGLLVQERNVGDVSSGRFERWIEDLQYFADTSDVVRWLFGGGANFVFDVNDRLSGVSINSLNFFIDSLLNHGVVGLSALVAAWIFVVRDAYRRSPGPYVVAMVVFIATAAVVTSPFEFPALGVLLAVGLVAVPTIAKDRADVPVPGSFELASGRETSVRESL